MDDKVGLITSARQIRSIDKLFFETTPQQTDVLAVIVEDLRHTVEAVDDLEDLIGNAIATIALQIKEVS